MLRIYNSLSQKKEIFKPLDKNQVLLYVCGITPYDTTHLGHAFLYIFFDALRRYLLYKGYSVNFTQNLTDIDDSILEKAQQISENWKTLGDFWNERFLNDMRNLNILPPTNYVRATESITRILEITKSLLKKGFAYETAGNVYFDVEQFPEYGKLSKFSKNMMLKIASERGADINDKNKKNPLDFILWQKSKKDEPFWDSPFSKGRPGWHIECSAMIAEVLGKQIDIHGGGMDLIFPHHESEIAQSESYSEKSPFVKYWIHTSMLKYQGEKMSKSLGNLVMIEDLLNEYSPNAVRFLLLSKHYRTPWEFKNEDLKTAQDKVNNLEKSLKNANPLLSRKAKDEFENLMDDDFNIKKVLVMLEKMKDKSSAKAIYEILGFIRN